MKTKLYLVAALAIMSTIMSTVACQKLDLNKSEGTGNPNVTDLGSIDDKASELGLNLNSESNGDLDSAKVKLDSGIVRYNHGTTCSAQVTLSPTELENLRKRIHRMHICVIRLPIEISGSGTSTNSGATAVPATEVLAETNLLPGRPVPGGTVSPPIQAWPICTRLLGGPQGVPTPLPAIASSATPQEGPADYVSSPDSRVVIDPCGPVFPCYPVEILQLKDDLIQKYHGGETKPCEITN